MACYPSVYDGQSLLRFAGSIDGEMMVNEKRNSRIDERGNVLVVVVVARPNTAV